MSITEVQEIIARHEKYAKCFFWTVNGNAASRRSQEFNYEYKVDGLEVRQSLSISCKNFYYGLEVYENGVKKDIRAVKRYLKSVMALVAC